MKKFLIFSTLVLLFFSCQKSSFREDELLAKRNALETAAPNLLLSSIIQKSAYLYQNKGGMGAKNLSCAVQYTEGNKSSDDNRYLNFRTPDESLYDYTGVIRFINAAILDVNKKGLKTHEGVFRIFKSLIWAAVTDLYGDIYYTQGLRGQEGILFPKFDEQKDIYPALIQNLKEASKLITDGTDVLDNSYDILYAGNKTKWTKFANSLRLRLMMRQSNKILDKAALQELVALPLITDVSENASISYFEGDASMSSPMGKANLDPNGNFLIFRPSKTLIDSLKALNDERLKVWVAPIEKPWADKKDSNNVSRTIVQKGFTYDYKWEYIDRSNPKIKAVAPSIIDSMTLFAGYVAGASVNVLNANGSYDLPDTKYNYKISKFSKLFNENANVLLKATMLQADEVQFLLAEAIVKGWITGDAKTCYENGVKLAMKRWGETTPSNYFSNPVAAFPAAKQQQLAKIGLQKWLGLFMMGLESYADYRRTRLPYLEANGELDPTITPFPLRYRYPQTELKNNASNYQEAVRRLDKGDTEFSKMWLMQ
nr:SusD/RagB family nutrient-binding outer membrane lipoprotein [Pedobacter sp. ASV19]